MKAVAVLSLMVGFASLASAANYSIPQSLNGKEPGDADLLGVDVIDSTGSTTNYGLAAPCYLHWVAISSAAASEFATLRDTDTLNSTSDIKLTLTTIVSSITSTQVITFNPPVIFRNGMSIKLNQNALGRWMFGYRRRLDSDIGADPTVGTSASD